MQAQGVDLPLWVVVVVALTAAGVLPVWYKGIAKVFNWLKTGTDRKNRDTKENRKELINFLMNDNAAHREQVIDLRARLEVTTNRMMQITAIGEHSQIAMWMKDASQKRLWQNAAYETLTGYSFNETEGKTDKEILGEGDAQSIVETEWGANDKEVIVTKRPLHTLEMVCHKDFPEKPFPCVVWKWPTIVGSTVVGVQGAAVKCDDIKNLYEANERLLKEVGHLCTE